MKLEDSIETQLLQLPPSERARLAELLLASLDAAEADVVTAAEQRQLDVAWAAEGERRLAELRSGAVAGIPAAQVYAELEAEIRGSDVERR